MTRVTTHLGSIQARGADTYRVVVSLGVDGTGKRMRKSITVNGSYADAERAKYRLLHTAEEQGLASSMRLDAWVTQWLSQADATRAPRTVAEYRRMLTTRLLPALGTQRLDGLQPRVLAQFFGQLARAPHARREGPISGHSQLKYYRLLSAILQEAVYHGLLTRNPLRQVRPPRAVRPTTRYYDQQAVWRLWEALQSEPLLVQVVLGLALLLGVRRGELMGLRWEDLDWQAAQVHIRRAAYKVRGSAQTVKVPKTAGSVRTIPLPAPLHDLLQQWHAVQAPQGSDFICCHAHGRWLHIDTPTRMLAAVIRRHCLPALSLHGLRHTAATVMLEAGVPLRAVSEHLGHQHTSTTVNIYAHATADARAHAGRALGQVVTPPPIPADDQPERR